MRITKCERNRSQDIRTYGIYVRISEMEVRTYVRTGIHTYVQSDTRLDSRGRISGSYVRRYVRGNMSLVVLGID